MRWLHALSSRAQQLLEGDVTPWVYSWLRIALATTLLVRHSDWLSRWIFLQHHRWVRGLDFLGTQGSPPLLVSPLGWGVALGPGWTLGLVYARTGLAIALLLGVRPRAAALALAAVSYTLLAADRYRYFHHLHLLYLAIACLSVAPTGERLSLEGLLERGWARFRALRVRSKARASPVWPLQVIRALVMSVYLSAGLGKLTGEWLAGDILAFLDQSRVLQGSTWTLLSSGLGHANLAKLTCATELALPALLAARSTRPFGIALGVLFHTLISACMMVSTFGVEMVILLSSFAVPVRRDSRVGTVGHACTPVASGE